MWCGLGGGLVGQGAGPGQDTFFRGWVSMAVIFPVSLTKENKPKSSTGGPLSFHLGDV